MSEQASTDNMERRAAELLARAEDFRRHGEDGSADAALALAEKIMLKFSLDTAVIAARRSSSGGPTESIITRTIQFSGIYRVALAVEFYQLVVTYSDAVQSFTSKGDRIEYLYVVGYDSDVRQLVTLVTSLQLQAIASLNRWWQRYPRRSQLRGMDGYKTRRQYAISFVRGAVDRIRQSRQAVLGAAEPGTTMVLHDRRTAVEEFVANTFNLTMRQTRLKPGTQDAADAGRSAGRRANTGDTAVGDDRRRITS